MIEGLTHLSAYQKMVLRLLVKILWRITDRPGECQSSSDIKLFTDIEVAIGDLSQKGADKVVRVALEKEEWG